MTSPAPQPDDFDGLVHAHPGDDAVSRAIAAIDAEPVPTGSGPDRWFARLIADPWNGRLWRWGAPALVVLLAAVLRLWHLGDPHALVFDETYYVKDAWTISHLGYEGAWPNNPDPSFNAGQVNGYTSAAEFVAHPPLGKWIIALGELAFGAGNAFGWRISTAVVGILAVWMVMVVAKRMFRGSTLVAVIAGFLMAIDGNAIVLSRVALLDNSVMFVALLGVWAVLRDREWRDARLAALPGDGLRVLWWRPWVFVAGILFGLDAGVKWSGFYYLAVFGVYIVLSDLWAYRRSRRHDWAYSAVVKQGLWNAVLIVPIGLISYVVTWTGWLVTTGGWDREWVQTTPGVAAKGIFSWVPYWAQNLWHYQTELYGYSITLHQKHPYQSNPLGWTLMLRPTSMYYVGNPDGKGGCTVSAGCSAAITELGNPFIWWAGSAAIILMIVLFAWKRDWKAGLLLAGLGAGWLPWVILYHGRTIFTFYSITFEPYIVIALAYALKLIVGSASDHWQRRRRGLWVVGLFLLLCAATTAFFWPIWTGVQTSYSYWHLHMWFASWI